MMHVCISRDPVYTCNSAGYTSLCSSPRQTCILFEMYSYVLFKFYLYIFHGIENLVYCKICLHRNIFKYLYNMHIAYKPRQFPPHYKQNPPEIKAEISFPLPKKCKKCH